MMVEVVSFRLVIVELRIISDTTRNNVDQSTYLDILIYLTGLIREWIRRLEI